MPPGTATVNGLEAGEADPEVNIGVLQPWATAIAARTAPTTSGDDDDPVDIDAHKAGGVGVCGPQASHVRLSG